MISTNYEYQAYHTKLKSYVTVVSKDDYLTDDTMLFVARCKLPYGLGFTDGEVLITPHNSEFHIINWRFNPGNWQNPLFNREDLKEYKHLVEIYSPNTCKLWRLGKCMTLDHHGKVIHSENMSFIDYANTNLFV